MPQGARAQSEVMVSCIYRGNGSSDPQIGRSNLGTLGRPRWGHGFDSRSLHHQNLIDFSDLQRSRGPGGVRHRISATSLSIALNQ